MKTKFNEFVNELYNGPGRSVGFKKTGDSEEYACIIPILINPALNIDMVRRNIAASMDENEIGQNHVELKKLGNDTYILTTFIDAHSKYEVNSMSMFLVDEIENQYNKDVKVLKKDIKIVRKDEPIGKKIGFK